MSTIKTTKSVYQGLIIFLVLLNSCATAYVPNTVNAPLLTNRKELQAAVYTGTSGIDPQVTYAVSDHIGIMLNGSFADVTSDSSASFHKHRFAEIGSGYYTHFGTRGKFETFIGAGMGDMQGEFENSLWTAHADLDYKRFFIQPSVGFTTKAFDAGISTRLVIVNLREESVSSTGVFLQPVLTGKLGYDHIKGVLQIGLFLPFNADHINFNYQPLVLSLGLQANFGKVFK